MCFLNVVLPWIYTNHRIYIFLIVNIFAETARDRLTYYENGMFASIYVQMNQSSISDNMIKKDTVYISLLTYTKETKNCQMLERNNTQ